MLIPIIVASIAGLGVLLVFFALAGARPMDPVQARLSQLGSMQAKTLEELELQQPLFERTLRPMAMRLSGIAQRFASPSKVSRTEKRLSMAGNPGALRTIDFLGMKLVVAVLAAGGSFVVLAVIMGSPPFGVVAAIALGALGFLAPELWLSRRIKKRQKQILLAVPDTLDLLTISVRAGLSFDGALAKVVEKTHGPLSDEFRRCLAEIRVGKVRRDALRDITGRTDVPALSNFIAAIVQAEQLGVPIAKVLTVQSEQLRVERRQRAEEMAAKAPIKMLFPLVGCIFPSMFIVILGPAIILIMLNMGTTQ
jgi:tight adherence protein C